MAHRTYLDYIEEKGILPLQVFEHRPSVASRYTDWFIPVHAKCKRFCSNVSVQINTKVFIIPYHLHSVPVHSANCAETYTVACRRVLSSAPL
jgi:hypothetical protein